MCISKEMERDQKKNELLQQSLESKRMEGEATIAMIDLKGQGINSIKGKEDEMINLKEYISILKEEVNRQNSNEKIEKL